MQIGAPAVDALIGAIHSDNYVLTNRAFELLEQIGDPRAIAPLSKAANISEMEYRAMTGDKGPTRTVNYFGMAADVTITDLVEEYRERAKKALDEIKEASGS